MHVYVYIYGCVYIYMCVGELEPQRGCDSLFVVSGMFRRAVRRYTMKKAGARVTPPPRERRRLRKWCSSQCYLTAL